MGLSPCEAHPGDSSGLCCADSRGAWLLWGSLENPQLAKGKGRGLVPVPVLAVSPGCEVVFLLGAHKAGGWLSDCQPRLHIRTTWGHVRPTDAHALPLRVKSVSPRAGPSTVWSLSSSGDSSL